MSNKIEITNNVGQKRMVSKEFADIFKKMKEHGEKILKNSRSFEEIPIEEFEDNNIQKSQQNDLKGGKADNKSIKDIAESHNVEVAKIKEQLQMGIKVEMEHTDDPKQAVEIAMDHLTESPEYYTKLAEMESSFDKEKEKDE